MQPGRRRCPVEIAPASVRARNCENADPLWAIATASTVIAKQSSEHVIYVSPPEELTDEQAEQWRKDHAGAQISCDTPSGRMCGAPRGSKPPGSC